MGNADLERLALSLEPRRPRDGCDTDSPEPGHRWEGTSSADPPMRARRTASGTFVSGTFVRIATRKLGFLSPRVARGPAES